MNNPVFEPHFSAEHTARKILYLKEQLAQLPKGLILTRHGKTYIRYKNPSTETSYHEKRIDSNEGRMIYDLICERKKIQDSLDKELIYWNTFYKNVTVPDIEANIHILPVPTCMTLDYYQNPPDIEDPYKPETPYIFEGLVLKSRFELIAAQAFKALGLEFKYDVPIVTQHGDYFMDMVVPVPERGRCVGFEFCGKTDDFKYMNSNSTKRMAYLSVGLIPNHDVIYVHGGQSWLPPTREIMNAIIFGVENC